MLLAFTYCASLTQHSRPRILDRLFSPILEEVLKNKERRTEWDEENSKLWSCWRPCIETLVARPVDLFPLHCVCLSVSQSPGPGWLNTFTSWPHTPTPHPTYPHNVDISTHWIRTEARPHGAEMERWKELVRKEWWRGQKEERQEEKSEDGKMGKSKEKFILLRRVYAVADVNCREHFYLCIGICVVLQLHHKNASWLWGFCVPLCWDSSSSLL